MTTPEPPCPDVSPSEQARTVADVAGRLGESPSQVALAWLPNRSSVMLPIPGTSSIAHLEDNTAAVALTLDAESVELLDSAA